MDEHSKIVLNEQLLRKVVRAIEKAIGEDIRDYFRDNRKETNNALRQMPGDNINENLRNMVITEEIDLIPFTRFAWDGRILIDRVNRITYTIMTNRNLVAIPKKKGRRLPHYLQSILYAENGNCKALVKQMTLADFGLVIFDSQELEDDYNKIMGGHISRDDNYRHYIIAYEAQRGELTDVTLRFLDKDFDIVDMCSLSDYIKPDFAKLTESGPAEEVAQEELKRAKQLVSVKNGIKPKIREAEKQA